MLRCALGIIVNISYSNLEQKRIVTKIELVNSKIKG